MDGGGAERALPSAGHDGVTDYLFSYFCGNFHGLRAGQAFEQRAANGVGAVVMTIRRVIDHVAARAAASAPFEAQELRKQAPAVEEFDAMRIEAWN